MLAVGVATHKVLMCQPYDIYCLGEAQSASPCRDVYYGRQLVASTCRAGNKWQT